MTTCIFLSQNSWQNESFSRRALTPKDQSHSETTMTSPLVAEAPNQPNLFHTISRPLRPLTADAPDESASRVRFEPHSFATCSSEVGDSSDHLAPTRGMIMVSASGPTTAECTGSVRHRKNGTLVLPLSNPPRHLA